MSRRTAARGSEIVELGQQEAEEASDAVARREMGISGPEFLRRWVEPDGGSRWLEAAMRLALPNVSPVQN
ncbi:MAG: hypothetical protein ACRDRE_10155 [Pseudonocardiaceae bacterium]